MRESLNIPSALHQELQFHELQSPKLQPHRNFGPEIQRDASTLLRSLQRLQQTRRIFSLPGQSQAKHGGVAVALVKLRQRTFTQFGSCIPDTQMASTHVIYANLFVRISCSDVDVKRSGQAVAVGEIKRGYSHGIS